jgi:hypothetical protein
MGITHQWVDYTSDIVTPEQTSVDPPQELSNSERDWPALPQHSDIRHDTNIVTTYQDTIHNEGSDLRPSVTRPTSRDTTVQMDRPGSVLTRIKKQRLNKSSEQLTDRKRTRNRAPTAC